jgi:hypothetical protein
MGANFQFRSLSQRHPPPLPEGSTDSRQDDSVGSRESVNLLNGCPGVRVSRLFLYLTPPLSRSGKKKTAGSGTRFRQSELASRFFLTTPPSKCLTPVSALVFGGWLLLTPPGNDVTRPQNEWHQEQAFDTLQQCANYRERQADGWIKRMETVPEGSPDYKTYDHAANRYLLGKCVLAESAS